MTENRAVSSKTNYSGFVGEHKLITLIDFCNTAIISDILLTKAFHPSLYTSI